MDLMAARRRILFDAPQIKTASGASVNFTAKAAAPLVSCQIAFSPVQAGSGDPSPSNPRPISAWSGITIYKSGADTSNPDTVAVSWQDTAGARYGGYVDLVSGQLVETHSSVDIGSIEWKFGSNNTNRQSWYSDAIPVKGISNQNDPFHGICAVLKTVSQNAAWRANMLCGGQTTGPSRAYLCVASNSYENADELRAAFSGVLIVYERASPQTHTISPVTLRTLSGINNFWTNSNGDLTLSYWG